MAPRDEPAAIQWGSPSRLPFVIRASSPGCFDFRQPGGTANYGSPEGRLATGRFSRVTQGFASRAVRGRKSGVKRLLAVFALSLSVTAPICAAETGAPVSFVKEVAPIFVAKCFACHN